MRVRLAGAMLLGALLSGCAGRVLPPPVAQTSALTGHMTAARISAIRVASLMPGNGGLDAVLAALGQTRPSGPVMGEELVLRRADGSATALAQPMQPGLTPGQDVTIVEAAATVLRPQ